MDKFSHLLSITGAAASSKPSSSRRLLCGFAPMPILSGFDFGNEFRQRDPQPGKRKVMLVNVTCSLQDGLDDDVRFDKVAHLTYKTQLAHMDVDPDRIDLNATVIRVNERSESRVFGATCPSRPYEKGYTGQCGPGLHPAEVVERTWHLTSRMGRQECQDKVLEVFCAYQYNDQGLCVPPRFLESQVFPQLGPRPPNLWADIPAGPSSVVKMHVVCLFNPYCDFFCLPSRP